MEAKSITQQVKKKRIRACKLAGAKIALNNFEKNTTTYCLTFGQFSLIEAIEAILEKTGPADVSISTWTAASADLEKATSFLNSGLIKSLRFMVDCSFINRQPGFARELVNRFGKNCIRTTRTHAKFVIIQNSDWDVVVETSMNLNENPRLENIRVTDDKEMADFMLAIVDGVFSEEEAGDYKTKKCPELPMINDTLPFADIEMARGSVTYGAATI